MKKVLIILCMFWMAFIAYNSSQNGYDSNEKTISITEEVVNKTQEIINNKIKDYDNVTISENYNNFIINGNKIIRKFAHAFEFLVLATILSFILQTFNIKRREVIIYTLFAVLLYAVLDEFHQLYVPGRTSAVKDVLIDFIGGIAGVMVSQAIFICKKFWQKNTRLNFAQFFILKPFTENRNRKN